MKNKKNNIKKEKQFNSISELVDDISFNLSELLIKESIIETKKKANIKLSNEEIFFDTYFIKPSILVRFIQNSKKERNN